jgi:aldose 1-epimerase
MTTLTDTITLAAGELEADFVPERGMIGTSLRHLGEELLGDGGIPFLHPWANRLAAHDYTVGGRTVVLPASVMEDDQGLPIHGLIFASPLWEVTGAARTGLRARLDFAAHPELLRAFPFPHVVELQVALSPHRLAIATTVHATGAARVPIAFGFHPYLRLPGVPREEWCVSLPRRRHLKLDAWAIPTGAGERRPATGLRLGERGFDDGYDRLEPGAEFRVAGGGRTLSVALESGYPAGQVFSPTGAGFICFEPMTAPANALRSGAGLRSVAPGESFTAVFSIGVASPRSCAGFAFWTPMLFNGFVN